MSPVYHLALSSKWRSRIWMQIFQSQHWWSFSCTITLPIDCIFASFCNKNHGTHGSMHFWKPILYGVTFKGKQRLAVSMFVFWREELKGKERREREFCRMGEVRQCEQRERGKKRSMMALGQFLIWDFALMALWQLPKVSIEIYHIHTCILFLSTFGKKISLMTRGFALVAGEFWE